MMNSGVARDEWVDALKAVALIGVGLINIQMLSYPDSGMGAWSREAFPSAKDAFTQAALVALVSGKFIAIFTMAFGWSMHAQLAQGPDSAARARRRLFALAAIGLLHAVFVFPGDILACYAIVGFVLLRSRDWSEEQLARSIRRWFAIIFGVIVFLATLVLVADFFDAEDVQRRHEVYIPAFRSGGYRDALIARYALHGYTFLSTITVGVLVAVPFARIGYLMRRFQEARGEAALTEIVQKWARKLLAPGLAIAGCSFAGLLLVRSDAAIIAFALLAGYPGGLTLGCAYGGLFTTVFSRPGAAIWRARLATVGRNSLSIYILQSLVAGFVMEGYGLGLYASVGPAALAVLSLLITATLGAFSLVWSRYFRLGPFERILRTLIGAPRTSAAA